MSLVLIPEAHAEWGLYKILEHMGPHEILPSGSGKNRAKLRKDIEEYLTAYAIDFDDADIDTFKPSDRTASPLTWKRNYVYSWNTREPWTQMKIGQRKRSRRKMTDTAPTRLHQPPQPSGEKRLESLSNQFHHRSTRLATHKLVPYETGVARCKE